MKGSPAKRGDIEGTSGHESALQDSALKRKALVEGLIRVGPKVVNTVKSWFKATPKGKAVSSSGNNLNSMFAKVRKNADYVDFKTNFSNKGGKNTGSFFGTTVDTKTGKLVFDGTKSMNVTPAESENIANTLKTLNKGN